MCCICNQPSHHLIFDPRQALPMQYDAQEIERMAEAICRQMRTDYALPHDWNAERERNKEAFRRAAIAAKMAQLDPPNA